MMYETTMTLCAFGNYVLIIRQAKKFVFLFLHISHSLSSPYLVVLCHSIYQQNRNQMKMRIQRNFFSVPLAVRYFVTHHVPMYAADLSHRFELIIH